MGAPDRLRSWGRRAWANPWLLVGLVVAVLLVCAWLAWAIHVWSDHGARQGLGVLIVWPAILAVLAVISLPFIWAFRVIRASARSGDSEEQVEPERAEEDSSENEPGAKASAAG